MQSSKLQQFEWPIVWYDNPILCRLHPCGQGLITEQDLQMLKRDYLRRVDKICMMTTRLACNRAIESSYWRMDNKSDVGLLTGYVLYRLPIELEFMDLDTFSRWFGMHPSLGTSW
jgi:hypothetical protein